MNIMFPPRITAIAAAILLTLTFSAANAATSEAQQEANRKAVLEFYEKGLNQKDADAALAYLGNRYVQHNPNAADGPEGFRKFIAFLREKFPNSRSEIKRSFVDGEYVILHVHAVREPGTRGTAIIDIFKLENGKIVRMLLEGLFIENGNISSYASYMHWRKLLCAGDEVRRARIGGNLRGAR